MKKTLMTIAALGIGAISLAAMTTDAEAGRKHGWGGHDSHHGKVFRHGHRNFRFGHVYGWFNGHNCRYYRNKARWTGKRFWWRKYNRCMDRFYRYY